MYSKLRALLYLGTIAIAVPVTAIAIPINYTESADFSGLQTAPTNLGDFDIGSNIISGSVKRSQYDYSDSFGAGLLFGHEITSIQLDLTYDGACNTTNPIDSATAQNLRMDGLIIANTGFTCDSGALLNPLSLTFPLRDTGFYSLTVGNINNPTMYPNILDVSSYRWVIEVAESSTEVPEPTPLALLALGLAGIGISRRVN